MVEKIKQWFAPPVFPDDEDKTLNARVLYALLGAVLLLIIPATLAMIFVSVRKIGVGMILLFLLILILAAYALVRQSRVRAASRLFVVGTWSLFALMYILGGRTTSAAASLLIAVVVMAGILLGERITIILAALSSLAILGIAVLETTGYPLVHYFPGPPIPSWATWTLAIFLTLKPLNLTIQSITRSSKSLRESEERLKFVLEGSQLGYWDWNIQTGQVQRNARWAEMLGYTLEEIEFNVKQWTDLQHPDDRAKAWQSIQDHLAGRTPAHVMEYRMRAKDGQYKWILDQAQIVARDVLGKPLRMSGTHADITDRKNTEEAERELRTLAEALSDSAAVLNSTLNFDNVLDRIMENVGRVVRHDSVGIILLDATRRIANLTRYHDNRLQKGEQEAIKFSVPHTRNLREMQASGMPVIITDTHDYEGWIRTSASAWIRSVLGAPIKIKDEVIGFLSLARAEPNSYTHQDAERLQAFVNYAGIAIENARLYEDVQRLALTDPLTGIFNRTFFETELARLGVGRDFPVSIVVADLDNMKKTNDRLGHAAGDDLLKHTVQVLQRIFRASDIIARVGGDEFAVLLPRTDSAATELMLSRVRSHLTEHNIDYPNLPIQLSLGVSTAEKGRLMDAFIVADQRMYEDKAVHKSSN